MSSTDGWGHYRAPLRRPAIAVHRHPSGACPGRPRLAFNRDRHLPWPKNPKGVTQWQANTVGVVQSQLMGDHLLDVSRWRRYCVWLDIRTGAMPVLNVALNNWLRRRMLDYLTVTLNVPKPEAETHH